MATSFAPDRSPVPGPSTWLPGGAYWQFRKDAPTFFTNTARTYGDIAGFKFGPQKVYLISKPEWIEDILVKSAGKFAKGIALERAKALLGEGLLTASGQHHLKQRRTIQPLFHRQHVQGFADAFVRHAARWRDSVTPGVPLDITREMSRLTLGIVGETLFSSDVRGDADEVRDALTDAVATFSYAFVPGMGLLSKLPIPVFRKMRTARERLDRVIRRVIAERRSGSHAGGSEDPPLPPDLVSMLLAARDPENPNEGGMSDTQIRDEAMTIFLAGHETTANAMAWTWHLLGSAPEVEARLHEELDRVLRQPQEGVASTLRTPTMEDVPKLEWTRAVVAESMRLFPPAWIMGSTCARGAHHWRPHHREARAGGDEPMGGAPRPPMVARARPLQARTLAGAGRRSPEVRILPLRRRHARLHRRSVRVDRGHSAGRHHRAALAIRERCEQLARARGEDHDETEGVDDDGVGEVRLKPDAHRRGP